ncbi:MAG: hypothetical protein M5R40_06740 [Anaerolineae bacterium]|nr:hypothetical protein [Anaerolineae bacterium]
MGHSTCFPVSMARGASFDPDLEKRIGDVIGQEARAQGANYFGGVCINLLRHPAWGRSQETYGEDPFLLGEMGQALVEGAAAQCDRLRQALRGEQYRKFPFLGERQSR